GRIIARNGCRNGQSSAKKFVHARYLNCVTHIYGDCGSHESYPARKVDDGRKRVGTIDRAVRVPNQTWDVIRAGKRIDTHARRLWNFVIRRQRQIDGTWV